MATNQTSGLGLLTSAGLGLAVLCLGGVATAQPAPPTKIVVGIYAPSIEFGAAQQRLAYVQGLAKAIESATGIKTEAQSYANVGALRKDNVDFAVIDGQCYATAGGGKLLATATINGSTTRAFALFASVADMQSLKGKKLAFVATGCNDAGFVDNAMLESEVDPAFFGARTGKPDLAAAVAEVASYKAAQAVFAPTTSGKGLTKLFDTGAVPNPAFVALGKAVPAAIESKVAGAVMSFGGGGAIGGWTKPESGIYASFGGRFGRAVKIGTLATPDPARLDARDVLIEPVTLKDTAVVDVRHHFVRAGDRLE